MDSVFTNADTRKALHRLATLENSRDFLHQPRASVPARRPGVDAVHQTHSHLAVGAIRCLLAGATRSGEQQAVLGRECPPAPGQRRSFRQLGQKSAVRHRRLAAPSAPAWGCSPPWTPFLPTGCGVPPQVPPWEPKREGHLSQLGPRRCRPSPRWWCPQSAPTSREHPPGVGHSRSRARVCAVSCCTTGVQSPRSHFLLWKLTWMRRLNILDGLMIWAENWSFADATKLSPTVPSRLMHWCVISDCSGDTAVARGTTGGPRALSSKRRYSYPKLLEINVFSMERTPCLLFSF